MKEIKKDLNLIAFCGLYCGACKKFLMDKCLGCVNNKKASWCKVRLCCLENKYQSCADCKKFINNNECKKLNNFFSKIIGFILKSNRNACLELIKEKGYEKFAEEMTKRGMSSIKK